MGRISQRKIDPDVEERVFEIFRNYLAGIHDPKEIQTFFLSLLSFTEQNMLAKRLAIAVLLKRGCTYRDIDDTIKVSKSTVTTVHKQILSGAEGYLIAIEKITNEKKYELWWNKMEEVIFQLSFPKQYNSSAWKKKSDKGKKLYIRNKKLHAV